MRDPGRRPHLAPYECGEIGCMKEIGREMPEPITFLGITSKALCELVYVDDGRCSTSLGLKLRRLCKMVSPKD